MKPAVYIETTIPSYLAARPSRDLIVSANQKLTHERWSRRDRFDLFVSQAVIDEASAGDTRAAARRLKMLRGVSRLEVTDECLSLGRLLLAKTPIPTTAATDAIHVATATIHRMNYLLTWNCAHIANATMRLSIEYVCLSAGYNPPVICTPQELMED